MIRVTITGSECTGKTTIAEALARHYGAPWVPEFARRFVLSKGAPPERDDVETIARGQIAIEDEIARRASGLLVLDTDLLSTIVYSRHYYGACPCWIEEAFDARAADLYLLADIDVPWIPEPGLRDRGDRRDELQGLFRRALLDRRLAFREIRGLGDRRLAAALPAVERLLGERGRAAR